MHGPISTKPSIYVRCYNMHMHVTSFWNCHGNDKMAATFVVKIHILANHSWSLTDTNPIQVSPPMLSGLNFLMTHWHLTLTSSSRSNSHFIVKIQVFISDVHRLISTKLNTYVWCYNEHMHITSFCNLHGNDKMAAIFVVKIHILAINSWSLTDTNQI